MSNLSGQLDIGGLQAEIQSKDPRHAQVHQDLADGINRLAVNLASSATGDIPAPKSPDSVAVATGGEFMHIAISHSGQLARNIHYFSEISTTPNFSQPIVIDHGSSRTSHPFPLPTFPNGGGSKTNYYVRSYAQYPGGPPSAPTVAGGLGSPTAFQMGGSTQLTLLPSNGSGTAPNNGQAAGAGLGRTQRRQS
jgi:hypothetical protein